MTSESKGAASQRTHHGSGSSSVCRQLQHTLFAAALVPFTAGTSEDLRPVPDADWPSAVEWRPSWHALRANCSSMATKLESLYAGDPVATVSLYSRHYKMQIYNLKRDIWISRIVMQQGGWESSNTRRIRDQFFEFPKAIFVDVGCNIGTFATAIKALLPKVPIFAFEPNRANAARFCRTVTLESNKFDLNNLYFFPYGLGNTTNVHGDFNQTVSDSNQGALKVQSAQPSADSPNRPTDPTDPNGTAIGVLQLDDLLSDVIQPRFPHRGHPVIMKIDVEGYQCEVLEGMRSFFEYYSLKYILLEWQPRRCNQQIVDLMQSMGLVPASPGGALLTDDFRTWPTATQDVEFRMRK
eukprot:GHVU01086585.1.p1 GENE.GHVU01086585.1~~GHVU01086585.1.p1  ORF type:complete len:387 (-),score=22.14 GHVU01086585.1:268-1326(-)